MFNKKVKIVPKLRTKNSMDRLLDIELAEE
jgi:hypothetical protein